MMLTLIFVVGAVGMVVVVVGQSHLVGHLPTQVPLTEHIFY
jgi:hypothetical protein